MVTYMNRAALFLFIFVTCDLTGMERILSLKRSPQLKFATVLTSRGWGLEINTHPRHIIAPVPLILQNCEGNYIVSATVFPDTHKRHGKVVCYGTSENHVVLYGEKSNVSHIFKVFPEQQDKDKETFSLKQIFCKESVDGLEWELWGRFISQDKKPAKEIYLAPLYRVLSLLPDK